MNTQKIHNLPLIKQLGFTLIEAMIAFTVAGVGILAVVSLQTELISTSAQSKAKAEALQLAQVKLEEFKNFTFDNATDFYASSTYADRLSYDANTDEEITGTNALFSRDYTLTTTGDIKAIAVNVSWTDVKDGVQNVTLNTSLTYESQAVIAAEGLAEKPTVTSATGAATIGAGTVDCDNVTGGCGAQGDGTSIAEDNGDLKLVIDGGTSADDKVVLTLEDACVSGTCTQFVRINGGIYVDRASVTEADLPAYNVNVLASDAAYCQRFYLSTDGTLANAIDADASVVSHTASNTTTYYLDNGSVAGSYDGTNTALQATVVNGPIAADVGAGTPAVAGTETPITANGNYNYFHYTCYLGGGWHGNIGILLSGGNTNSDKFCLGDPNSVYTDEQPVIAARRAYRGMTYKDIVTPFDNTDTPVKETYLLDSVATTKYYSQGISDGAQIGGQDFVIGKNTHPNTNEGDYCVTDDGPTATYPFSGSGQTTGFMTRTDSTEGALFAGVPADWYCLNENGLISPELPYGYDNTCPYDPTSPPNSIYTVSGNITITSANSVIGSYNGSSINSADTSSIVHVDPGTSANTNVNFTVETSQGTGNCTQTNYSTTASQFSSTYTCNTYDWADDAITGWTGSILSSVADDVSDNFICSTPIAIPLITANYPNQHITCVEGAQIILSGTITNPLKFNSVTATGTDSLGEEANGTCTFTASASPYSCTIDIPIGTTWTGNLVFNTNAKPLCYDGSTATDDPIVDSSNYQVTYATALNSGTYSAENVHMLNSGTCPAYP